MIFKLTIIDSPILKMTNSKKLINFYDINSQKECLERENNKNKVQISSQP